MRLQRQQDSDTAWVRIAKEHLNRGAFYLLLLIGICLIPFALAQRTTWHTPANIITVTNVNDSGAGSLRQALADANDGDTINFALSGTISLTNGELVIDKNITISGPGSNLLTVRPSQGSFFRVFKVMPSHSITIQGITISFGYAGFAQGGGVYLDEHVTATIADCVLTNNFTGDIGGAIFIDGYGGGAMLTVLNSTITGNTAGNTDNGGSGAGIYSSADVLTIIDSTISNNTAWIGGNLSGGDGGGIINVNGTLEISNTTISSNLAGVSGGGISGDGTITITNSTISGNVAGITQPYLGLGGGIYTSGTLTVTNCTITGNSAYGSPFKGGGVGGGIYNGNGSADVANSTLSDNHADVHGGSIYGGTFDIGNSILNGGGPENISTATVTSHGYNVCSDAGGGFLNGPGDQINTNPLLGPLQDNGGPTFTHELLTGSPAIDAGDPNFTPPPYYDQRGPDFWRVRNGRIDVGAFEVQAGSTPTPTPTPTPTTTPRATPIPRPRPSPHPRP
jgi:predicted outer membrane repeat protein